MFIDSDYIETGNELNCVFYTKNDEVLEWVIILNRCTKNKK